MTEGTRHSPQLREPSDQRCQNEAEQCRNDQWLEDLPTHIKKDE